MQHRVFLLLFLSVYSMALFADEEPPQAHAGAPDTPPLKPSDLVKAGATFIAAHAAHEAATTGSLTRTATLTKAFAKAALKSRLPGGITSELFGNGAGTSAETWTKYAEQIAQAAKHMSPEMVSELATNMLKAGVSATVVMAATGLGVEALAQARLEAEKSNAVNRLREDETARKVERDFQGTNPDPFADWGRNSDNVSEQAKRNALLNSARAQAGDPRDIEAAQTANEIVYKAANLPPPIKPDPFEK